MSFSKLLVWLDFAAATWILDIFVRNIYLSGIIALCMRTVHAILLSSAVEFQEDEAEEGVLQQLMYNFDITKLAVFGREFSNPLGLAAGCDKQAEAAKQFMMMGFGFVEVGSVTPQVCLRRVVVLQA